MYRGAHIQTKEAFLCGRFEGMIKPAYGSGVISSFFLFNDRPDFKTNWQELDFEWLGRNTNSVQTNMIRTIGGVTNYNASVRNHTLNKRSEDTFWKVSIQWSPTEVVWALNDAIIRTMPVTLKLPMKLMLNLWTESSGWAGEFSPGLLPQQSQYEYIRVSKYVGGRYVLAWQEEFNALDMNRWMIGTWQQGNTQLMQENVTLKDSRLSLALR